MLAAMTPHYPWLAGRGYSKLPVLTLALAA
jgi:hypothetical protein